MSSTTLVASGTAVLGRTRNQARMADNDERMRLRILESKFRAIGIDKDALDAKVAEMAASRAAEAEEEKRYAEALAEAVARAEDVAAEEAYERADEHAKLRAYWRHQEDRSLRPEWDLNDPAANRKALPPRDESDISRCGPSSIQVFESEFSESPQAQRRRARDVAEENRRILQAKREATKCEREEERLEALRTTELTETLTKRDWDASVDEVDAAARLRAENRRLAAERKTRERLAKEEERAREREHVEKMRNSALLTEHRSQVYGAYGPDGKKRRDHYKGMSKEELRAIREEQARQRAEAEAARRREKEEAASGGDLWTTAATTARELEATAAAEASQSSRKYYLELKAQQRAQRLARKKAKEEEDAVVDWRGGILDGFNKRGR